MSQSVKMFEPLKLRALELKNRIAVSPMATYSAVDGYLTPFHQTHYGRFAMGGAGLVMVEQTSVARNGRITNGDPGLWDDRHIDAMRRLVVHLKGFGAGTGIQINHGGRKCSQQRAFRGNGPLNERDFAAGEEAWQPLAPSAVPLAEDWQTPLAMTPGHMEGIREAFVAAAQRAMLAGFDLIELHMAHGYLLQNFLSPIANIRDDAYGGTRENRMRFPLEVTRAVRAVMPDSMPLLVRISASDWMEGGWTIEDSVAFSVALKEAGVDLVDCSSGGNMRAGATNSNLARGPGYQVQFADRIRREAGVPTAAVGMIRTPKFAEHILQRGQADLICVGRQMLFDPFWAHHAAEELGVTGDFSGWPPQYGWWLEKWARSLQRNGESPMGAEVFPELAE